MADTNDPNKPETFQPSAEGASPIRPFGPSFDPPDEFPVPDTTVPALTMEQRLAAIEAMTKAQAEENARTQAENARLLAQIKAMQSAKRGKVLPVRATCNDCGDEVDPEKGCPRHPGTHINHSGPDENNREFLVKQTRIVQN